MILTLNVANPLEHLEIPKHLLIKQIYEEHNAKLIKLLNWLTTEIYQKYSHFWDIKS